MANYKKYAENLVGDWETGQYEPQREALQKSYNTNWQKLTNEFNVLKDKLNKKMSDAQINYGEEINNIQNNAYNRMNNAYQDLANRGLTGSGMVDLTSRANTKTTGEEADKALSDLLSVTSEGVSGLYNAANKLAEQQSSLSGNLANALADVGDAESGNGQQYANLIAGIADSAEGRAASRSGSGKTKDEKEDEEFYRILGIIDTLNDSELSDDDKKYLLKTRYDVDVNTGSKAIKGYNNNKLLDETNNKISKLTKSVDKLTNAGNTYSRYVGGNNGSYNTLAELFNVPRALSIWQNKSLQKQKDKINGLTYSDLNEILFGKK